MSKGVLSVCSSPLDKETIGCLTEGSSLWVVSSSGSRSLVGSLTDDLPLLCCVAHNVGNGLMLVAGAGLSPTDLVCGLVATKDSAKKVDEGEEPTKRHRKADLSVSSCMLRVSDRGAINAVALHAQDQNNHADLCMLWAFLGCQNGDVVRLSLRVSASAISVVGSEEIVHSHRMDVRSIAVNGSSGRLLSCSDDGTLQVSMLLGRGSPLIAPLLVSREAELLSCCFLGEDSVVAGARDRRIVVVELGLDGVRKKKEATWLSVDAPHVPRWIGLVPGTKQVMFSGGDGVLVQSNDNKWLKCETMTMELMSGFQCVCNNFSKI